MAENTEVSVRSLSEMQTDSMVNSTIQSLDELAKLDSEYIDSYPEWLREQKSNNLSEFPVPETRVDGLPDSNAQPCSLEFKETSALELPDKPVYSSEEVVINEVAPPLEFSVEAPTSPTTNKHSVPLSPDSEMPDAPTMRDLELPDINELNEVDFTGVFPDDIYANPDVDFFYIENDYTSELLSTLNARLLSYLSGESTGLSQAIEQAIFDTFRDDIQLSTKRTVRAVTKAWGGAGWSMPSGELRENLYLAEEGAGREKVKESRRIAKDQANLEQKNLHFSISKSIELEDNLLTYSNLANQRAFDAAKYSVQITIDLYKLKVARFLSKHKAAGVNAAVYVDRVNAELSKLELYKVKIEKQALINEVNSTDVKLYTEQIKSVTSLFDLYKIEIEAVNVELENDKLLIMEYGAKASSFYSDVKAKSSEYKRYKTELDSELTKLVSHSTDSDIFKKKMEAYHSTAKALESEKNIEIKVKQEIPIDVCLAKSKESNAKYEALINDIRIDAAAVRFDAEIYDGQLATESIEFGSKVDMERSNLKVDAANVSLNLDVARVNQASSIASAALRTDSSIASKRIEAQQRAAEISSINVNTSTSKSTSTSSSTSASDSRSDSTSFSGSTSKSSVTIHTDSGGAVDIGGGCPF